MPLVRLYSADDVIEAHLLKHMLEQTGMQAFITGEHLGSGIGELPTAGLIDVWVLHDHLEAAQDVLDDFFETLDGPPDDDDPLIDAEGYYDDHENENDDLASANKPIPLPAHSDPADPENPWNHVYRKK